MHIATLISPGGAVVANVSIAHEGSEDGECCQPTALLSEEDVDKRSSRNNPELAKQTSLNHPAGMYMNHA